MLRRAALALGLLVPLAGTHAAPARADVRANAEPLDLEWVAPAECPGREAVLEHVRRVLGDVPLPHDAERVSAEVSVVRTDDGRWHVRIVTLGASGGERLLDSASCSALTDAVALVLAIRIRPSLLAAKGATNHPVLNVSAPPPPIPPVLAPMPPPPPRPVVALPARHPARAAHPPEELPSRPTGRRGAFSVGFSGVGTLGELPAADASGELTLAYAVGRLRVELHGETGFVQTVATPLPGAPLANTTFRAAGAGARGCYGPSFGAFELMGCADGEVDAMWATGQGFAASFSPNGVWGTLGALVAPRYRLTKRLALHAFVETLAPLQRAQFVTETSTGGFLGPVHEPSAVWGRAGFGLDAILFLTDR